MSPKITNSANNHSEHRAAFGFFLGLIVWAPLPFGSNILWSEMLLALACFLLTALVLISDLRAERSPYVNRVALIPFLILVSAQVYLLIQLSFPEISSLGFVGTIEPFSTQIQLLSGLALCSAFYITLKTVTTGKRTVWFLGAIVVSGLLQATYGSVMTLSGLEYGFFIEKIVNGLYLRKKKRKNLLKSKPVFFTRIKQMT